MDHKELWQEGTIVPIYKPKGLTSHDVVDRLRELTGIKKIGHAGTLDPLAEGVLVVGIGRSATKRLQHFLKFDKEYRTEITFGVATDTYDADGQIIGQSNCWKNLQIDEIKKSLHQFIGAIDQLPPPFSAKKIAGKRAYQLARAGQTVKLKPTRISIYSIQIINWQPPRLKLNIHCGAGTYIRSLAHDLGQVLKCPAHLSALVRTRVGQFTLQNCLTIEEKIEKFKSKY